MSKKNINLKDRFLCIRCIVLVHQFPFRLTSVNDPLASSLSMTKTSSTSAVKPQELPKLPFQRNESESRKRRNPVNSMSKSALLNAIPSATPLVPAPVPGGDAIKVVPLTLFDFNGSPEYYDHISTFLDTHALHLICIPTTEFHEVAPKTMEDLFNGKFDLSSSSILSQLLHVLQFLCDKASKTRAIMILPIATRIDLYDTRSPQDR